MTQCRLWPNFAILHFERSLDIGNSTILCSDDRAPQRDCVLNRAQSLCFVFNTSSYCVHRHKERVLPPKLIKACCESKHVCNKQVIKIFFPSSLDKEHHISLVLEKQQHSWVVVAAVSACSAYQSQSTSQQRLSCHSWLKTNISLPCQPHFASMKEY